MQIPIESSTTATDEQHSKKKNTIMLLISTHTTHVQVLHHASPRSLREVLGIAGLTDATRATRLEPWGQRSVGEHLENGGKETEVIDLFLAGMYLADVR